LKWVTVVILANKIITSQTERNDANTTIQRERVGKVDTRHDEAFQEPQRLTQTGSEEMVVGLLAKKI